MSTDNEGIHEYNQVLQVCYLDRLTGRHGFGQSAARQVDALSPWST